jgi:prepilin-type N-terminal cleavage/methylation domain-containing protein
MKNRSGFTLIELALVMVILGTISAFTLIKYQKTVAANQIEKAANSLYQELRAARSLAFRWDSQVIIKFTPQHSLCTICIDTNSNGVDQTDICSVHRLPPRVSIGNPLTEGIPSLFNYAPVNGLAHHWKDSLTIDPDSRGNYSHGAVYLVTDRLPKTAYCIGIPHGVQSLYFCKWEVAQWDTL